MDLLIDADMYLFAAASSCEVETDWGNDHWTLHSDAGEVRRAFGRSLEQVSDELSSEGIDVGRIVLCFSDPSRRSFRHDLTETYKQARKATRKPLAYAAVRDQLCLEYKTIIKPRLEADDVMGIVSTRAPGKFVIVSGDKDMKQVPGLLYRQRELEEITVRVADVWFFTQTLTGDPTDGYPGCPGIGEKKAAEILAGKCSNTPTAWGAISAAYKKAGLAEADALLQARLARILRCTEWDFDKSEVKLWTP